MEKHRNRQRSEKTRVHWKSYRCRGPRLVFDPLNLKSWQLKRPRSALEFPLKRAFVVRVEFPARSVGSKLQGCEASSIDCTRSLEKCGVKQSLEDTHFETSGAGEFRKSVDCLLATLNSLLGNVALPEGKSINGTHSEADLKGLGCRLYAYRDCLPLYVRY